MRNVRAPRACAHAPPLANKTGMAARAAARATIARARASQPAAAAAFIERLVGLFRVGKRESFVFIIVNLAKAAYKSKKPKKSQCSRV